MLSWLTGLLERVLLVVETSAVIVRLSRPGGAVISSTGFHFLRNSLDFQRYLMTLGRSNL